jgi:hypothetical protein
LVAVLFLALLITATVALIASQAQISTSDTKMNRPVSHLTNNETSSGVIVEVTEYPLKAVMTVGKTELKHGEALPINFTVENIGDQALTMYFSDGCDQSYFFI